MDPALVFGMYTNLIQSTAFIMVSGHQSVYLYDVEESGAGHIHTTNLDCGDSPALVDNPIIESLLVLSDVQQLPKHRALKAYLAAIPDRTVVCRFGHGRPVITMAVQYHVPVLGRVLCLKNVHVFHVYVQLTTALIPGVDKLLLYGLVSPDDIYAAATAAQCSMSELSYLHRGNQRVPLVVEEIPGHILPL